MNTALIFDTALANTKPETMHHKDNYCPFCDTTHLTNILAQEKSIIWLLNKYPVLRDTWPTIIIETDHCHSEFSEYPLNHAEQVLTFTLSKWQETIDSKRFASVLCFKNHGPMSGGSIRHPHSQIIGLKDYDYHLTMEQKHFDGWLMYEEPNLQVTLSKEPLIGFSEFNIHFTNQTSIRNLAKTLQDILHYILREFARFTSSYNYFFYTMGHDLYIKIVPRYVTPPLFVGYGIPETYDDARADRIKSALLPYLTTASI
ncbi:MAG: DUF4931 domain-containing protein [Veillonellaceae bacterium]|nr:DUF4931 domain-containing protein [Veillonellaceae bacterium]